MGKYKNLITVIPTGRPNSAAQANKALITFAQ
jgi:hypothetical protein